MFFKEISESLPLEKVDLSTCNIQKDTNDSPLEQSIRLATNKRDFPGLKTVYEAIKEKHTSHIDATCVLDWICRNAVGYKYTVEEFEKLKEEFPEVKNTRMFEYTVSGFCRPPEDVKASFIHLALSSRNQDLFNYFVDNGADINQVNHKGKTPKQVIQKEIKSYAEQIKMCIQYKRDVPSYYTEPKEFYESCLDKLNKFEPIKELVSLLQEYHSNGIELVEPFNEEDEKFKIRFRYGGFCKPGAPTRIFDFLKQHNIKTQIEDLEDNEYGMFAFGPAIHVAYISKKDVGAILRELHDATLTSTPNQTL